MHIKLKRIKGVRQIGPTCGIFALSMIVATYEGKGKYEYNKRVNELAYQMLDLAIAYKLTQMGEIFNSQTLQSLIDIINSSGILEKNTRIVCEKKEFDEGSLKSIILDAINNKKYIMFPYYSSCGAVRSKCSSLNMKHVHWGVIDNINNKSNKVSGVEGNMFICRVYSLFRIPKSIGSLIKSNRLIGDRFSWREYFKGRWVKGVCITERICIRKQSRRIMGKIYVMAKLKKLKEISSSIDIDLRGKLFNIYLERMK